MAIVYPTSLDSLSNPIATDPTLNPGNPLDHAIQHSDLNDAVEALQVKVGINASGAVASLDNKVTSHLAANTAVHGITGAVVGTTDTQTLTNKSISGATNTITAVPKASVVGAPVGTVVGTTDTQTLTNKTLSGASNTITGIAQASVTNLTTDIATATAAYAPVSAIKNSDQSVTSSIVVVNDSALVLTLVANRTYEIELVLGATGAAAGDIRTSWTLSGTATATTSRTLAGPVTAATNVFATSMIFTKRAIGVEVIYGVDGSTDESLIIEKFIVAAGASGGTVQLRWAQGVASATATIAKAGSYIIATRLT